ncbi:MAG: PadR family transcriptional regulator [Dehalococcoidales bacterium]|nr:PadR family transcriptional regulator [Dehalococcoidales bacterium]
MFGHHRYNEDRYYRGSRRGSSFQKGDLKYIILDLIKDTPRHGYDIIRELEEQSYGTYKPSPGVIYPTLQMLEEMGHAVSEEQEGKKVYSITEEGKDFLAKQKNKTNGVRSQMKRKWSFKNIGKMVMVMKEYHALEDLLGRSIRGQDPEKMQRIRGILIQAYDDIESILEE